MGALGRIELAEGRHAYAGSALGPGGVRARLARHVGRRGRRHWHVDHLRGATRPVEAWWVHDGRRLECRWAAAVAGLPGCGRPAAGFGASDCGCPGHLVRLPAEIGRSRVAEVLAGASPDGLRPARAPAPALSGSAGG